MDDVLIGKINIHMESSDFGTHKGKKAAEKGIRLFDRLLKRESLNSLARKRTASSSRQCNWRCTLSRKGCSRRASSSTCTSSRPVTESRMEQMVGGRRGSRKKKLPLGGINFRK